MEKDVKNLAIEVIRAMPEANIKELMKAAMKRNKGAMNPKDVEIAIKEELIIDLGSLLITIEELSKGCDARMDTKLDDLLSVLEERVREIRQKFEPILNETQYLAHLMKSGCKQSTLIRYAKSIPSTHIFEDCRKGLITSDEAADILMLRRQITNPFLRCMKKVWDIINPF